MGKTVQYYTRKRNISSVATKLPLYGTERGPIAKLFRWAKLGCELASCGSDLRATRATASGQL